MTKLLDERDKKLLHYLSLNSRTSHTQLAKKLKLSTNAVKYRISRLQKKGVIKNFATVVNIGAIKYDTFTILLKFNEDIYDNPAIIEFFKKHPYANWIVSLSGQWDIFAEIVFKDFNHIIRIIKEIISFFNSTLNTYEVFFSQDVIKVEHLIGEFCRDLELEDLPPAKRISKKVEIDNQDKKILHLISKNSSLPFHEISQSLGISLDIVRYRMKKLQENGVIVKFFPEISLEKLGYTEYLYTIKLKNATNEKIGQLKNKILNNDNTTYAFFDSVSLNLVFVCAFRSTEGIDHLSRGLRKQFSGIIDYQDYLIIKEQILFDLFPKGLLNETSIS